MGKAANSSSYCFRDEFCPAAVPLLTNRGGCGSARTPSLAWCSTN